MLLAALLCAPSLASAGPTLKSGQYENLLLAVAPDHRLTGYYRETQGEGVEKTCSFYLAGTDAGDVTTWNAQAFPGHIEATADGVSLRVEKGREHPGCALVLMPQIATGLALDLSAATEWTDLATVAKPRANLYPKPDPTAKTRSFVVARDVVGVLERAEGWVRVEYRHEGKSVKGWVRSEDIAEVKAP